MHEPVHLLGRGVEVLGVEAVAEAEHAVADVDEERMLDPGKK